MADKPKKPVTGNKSQGDQLKELDSIDQPPADITGSAPKVEQAMMPPPSPTPSMFNPLWQLAARMQGVSPINEMPMPGGPMAQFQQGPMQLPPPPSPPPLPSWESVGPGSRITPEDYQRMWERGAKQNPSQPQAGIPLPR